MNRLTQRAIRLSYKVPHPVWYMLMGALLLEFIWQGVLGIPSLDLYHLGFALALWGLMRVVSVLALLGLQQWTSEVESVQQDARALLDEAKDLRDRAERSAKRWH